MSEQDTIGDRTLTSLLDVFKTDPRSSYARLNYHSRTKSEVICRRIEREHGSVLVGQIKDEHLTNWHKEWKLRGPTIAHTLMTTLRTVFAFGGIVLADVVCKRLAVAIYEMRLPSGPTGQASCRQPAKLIVAAHRPTS